MDRLPHRLRGEVTLWRDGVFLWREKNLIVNASLPALANLTAGVTTGQYVSAVGFGSGSTAPALTDTDLGAAPKYYNAVVSHTFPSSGAVQFVYQLSTTADYAAEGITVSEVGLYSNSAAIAIPDYVGAGITNWVASTAYSVGALAIDSNGRVQRCTTAGTSASTHPTWATVLGNTTTDNTANWTLIAGFSIPSPMWAHVVVPAFEFTSAGSYSGTWQLTF